MARIHPDFLSDLLYTPFRELLNQFLIGYYLFRKIIRYCLDKCHINLKIYPYHPLPSHGAYLTDTPVFEFLTSGKAKEANPELFFIHDISIMQRVYIGLHIIGCKITTFSSNKRKKNEKSPKVRRHGVRRDFDRVGKCRQCLSAKV